MPAYAALGTLSRVISDLPWPVDFFSVEDLPDFLNKIFVLDFSFRNTETGYTGLIWLAFEKELSLEIPGLAGVSIVAGKNLDDVTFLTLGIEIGQTSTIKLIDTQLALRYEGSLLTPVPTDDNPNPTSVDLVLGGTIVLDSSFHVTFEDFDSVDLLPAMIGKTGIIISAEDVKLDISRTETPPEIIAAGFDNSFLGIFIGTATVQFPEGFPSFVPDDLVLENCAIGSGGVSGLLTANYLDDPADYNSTTREFVGRGGGKLFGVPFAVDTASIEFKRGTLVDSRIIGRLALPYFDKVLDVELGLQLDGGFTVRLTGMETDEGLLTFTKEDLMTVVVDSLKFTVDDGTLTTSLSGTITPEVGGLDWPSFRVKELAIDSEGNVRLEGGWLDLPEQYSLNFYDFQLEITKIGFGKPENGPGRWLGFSGGIKLLDGIPAGASVDGLRITWIDGDPPDIDLTLNGVGVEFEIPNTLHFKGNVSYDGNDRFDGSLTANLLALDMSIDGKLLFGPFPGMPGQNYGALYLALEAPAGIPLLSTGVGIYGMAGLIALRMKPGKASDQDWYRMGGGPPSWFHYPSPGVEVLGKWIPDPGSFGLGAGVTLATIADNGRAFAGRFLFVVVLPGPILLLQGAANILKARPNLDDLSDPQFRALAVLDGQAGTLLIGLDAQYKYNEANGSLLDIRGSAEAFFSFDDPTRWHLYLGQRTPQELRIRASLAKGLFPEANAYFMLDGRQLAMGAWIGFNQSWDLPPVHLSLEAWIEGNALVSWRPTHLNGNLCMHGDLAIEVFRFGIGLTMDACLTADVREPFHLVGTLNVGIDLPRPFDDITINVSLEWGPEPVVLPISPQADGTVVPLPAPLKEIAIEHLKVTTSWPPAGPEAPQGAYPVVPLDCRPHLTFERPTHDTAQVGMNGQAVVPDFEPIGDPSNPSAAPIEARYALEEVILNKWVNDAWVLFMRKGATANPMGIPTLFGSWAAVPSLPDGNGGHVGQTKLWLWSKTPFDYTRHTGGAWDDGFGNRYTDYPHCGSAPDQVRCCTFEDVLPGNFEASPLPRFDVPGLTIGWQRKPAPKTVAAVAGLTSATAFPAKVFDAFGGSTPNEVTFELPPGTTRVTLLIGDEPETCIDFTDRPATGLLANPYVESGASFVSFTGGVPAPNNAIVIASTTAGPVSGIECRARIEITLPYSSGFVDLRITCASPPATVDALGPTGNLVARIKVNVVQQQTTVRFTQGPINKVVITCAAVSGTTLHHLCFEGVRISQAQATASGVLGVPYGPVPVVSHVLDVTAAVNDELRSLVLTAPTLTCLLQVCVTVPSPERRAKEHIEDERARWTQTAPILDPHSAYELIVRTSRHTRGRNGSLVTSIVNGLPASHDDIRTFLNYAYFRTEGPPALATLTLPTGPTVLPTDQVNTSLDTLDLYVDQTIPATVPEPGEKPLLPRPVYRAYDVGVQFNEDYVDLMYRLDGRDLGLYLYDRSNRPVRDAEGRLLALTNLWGQRETAVLDRGERRWVNAINNSECLPGIDTNLIPRDVSLTSAAPGLVLDADTVYEARLTPLLVHEDFTKPAPGALANNEGAVPGWTVQDDAGPSAWQVGSPAGGFITQVLPSGGGVPDGNDPEKPGTMLKRIADPNRLPDDPSQPANWSDYRVTVTLRTGEAGAIGVAFRMTESQRYYRFSLDRSRRYRRLVRVGDAAIAGVHAILAEDNGTLDPGRDTVVTVEAVGASLRVYQDGALVFDVMDDTFATGGIGLYAWQNPDARFIGIRVDDFSATSVIAYRFTFTTSQFATFVHQLHSFEDEAWPAEFAADPGLVDAAADAQLLTAPVTEAETRACGILAAAVFGSAARQDPARLEATRVTVGGQLRALFLRGPEPIDWTRTALVVRRADADLSAPARVPGALKLTGATFAALQPADESVTLVTRTELNPSGSRVECLTAPGPLEDPPGSPIFLRDDFDGPDSGILYGETFGPNALDRYTLADKGAGMATSNWSSGSTEITQAKTPGAPGKSFAAPRTPAWTNTRVSVVARSDGDSEFGIAVRYRDPDNYYACVLDTSANVRRILKVSEGISSMLFQSGSPLMTGQDYRLSVDVSGDRILFYLDDILVAVVMDGDIPSGGTALYSALATGAHFSSLSVEALEAPALLHQPMFEDAAEIDTVFGHVTTNEPFQWTAAGGLLTQTSSISDPAVPDQAATFAVLVSEAWTDADVSVRMMSSVAGFLGVAVRWTDVDNAYRFSVDSTTGQAHFLKIVSGVVTTLWTGTVTVSPGQTLRLTVRTEGSRLSAFLGGVSLFSVLDSALASGYVALFCGGNPGATFVRVTVRDRVRRVGGWAVMDEGSQDYPSLWRLGQGLLRQSSLISGGVDPNAPGTVAARGDTAWTDYRVSARMSTSEAHPLGIVFRYRDRDNYYRFSVDATTNLRTLVKKTGGVFTTLWPLPSQPGTSPVGAAFTLTADVLGQRIVGYLNGERLFEVVDGDHAAGAAGLYCAANSGAAFENMDVRRPSAEAYALLADRFPGDVSAWTFIPDNTQGVAGDLAWTDILLVARVVLPLTDAVGVIVRHAGSLDFYNFTIGVSPPSRQLIKIQGGVVTVLWNDAAPLIAGRAYELGVLALGGTLRCFIDGVPVCVVNDTSPVPAGKIGLTDAGAQIPTRFAGVTAYGADRAFLSWLFDEPFDEAVPGRWTIEDAGEVDGPSVWTVVNGVYAQTSGITGGAPGDVARRGTFAVAGDPTWTDYRLTVRLASSEPGDIGVLVRYIDPENYYLLTFTLDANLVDGRRRLIAVSAGVATVMTPQDSIPYVIGRESLVTVDCVGTSLRAFVDGILVFSVIDDRLPFGRIGLYASANPGAEFAEVRVAPYDWIPYYPFEGEERLPAGTRIRLVAGSEAMAPPAAPGVLSRFLPFGGERGRVRFPANSVDLRVVTDINSAGHTRRFQPPSAFTAADLRVLRNADGTGLALLDAAGAAIADGVYRAEWTFRRDNRASVPESLVFTEAGDDADEQVTIDIPGPG